MKRFLLLAVIFVLIVFAGASQYTMSFLYLGSTPNYIAYAGRTNGAVNSLAPDYFALDQNGNLVLSPKVDSVFIDAMHAQNMAVAPCLNSHWNREHAVAALDNMEALTTQISAAVAELNLDGVNIDLQNLPHTEKDRHTQFVGLLRQKLPPGAQLSVSVAANPKGWTTGWHGSYDYAKLALNCDFLLIMAYDESYAGSPPGPVASYEFVENSVKYALKYVAPDKLVLGLPLFGRYWKRGAAAGGNGISQMDAYTLSRADGARLIYHAQSHSQQLLLTVPQGESYTIWGNRKLDPGEYEIWFDDIETIEKKLGLVKEHGLLGSGTWALGQENPEIWPVYFGAVNSPNFHDTQTHWAQKEIAQIYQAGWMQGKSSQSFHPTGALTRAEAAVILARAAQLDTTALGEHFADTQNHWASGHIAAARAKGYVLGADDTMFHPDLPLTREQLAALIERAFNLPTSIDFETQRFADLPKNRWSFSAVTLLAQNQIVHGYPDESFKPDRIITRGEMAAILSRVYGFGIKPASQPQTTADPH